MRNRSSITIVAMVVILIAACLWVPVAIRPKRLKDGEAALPVRSAAAMTSKPSDAGVQREPQFGALSASDQTHTDRIQSPDFSFVPERLRHLLNSPTPFVQSSVTNGLMASDAPVLMEAFKNLPLTNRARVTWALAATGDERVVGLFRNTLTNDFHGVDIGQNGKQAMFAMVQAMSLLVRQETAASFLKDGMEFQFWDKARPWTCPSDRYQDTARQFSGACLNSLSLGGHPDAVALTRSLAQRAMSDAEVQRMAGSIVASAEINYWIKQKGVDCFRDQLLNAKEVGLVFWEEWKKTPDGQAWKDWSTNVRKGLPVKIPDE